MPNPDAMKITCLPLLALLMLLRPLSTGPVDTVAQLLGKGSAHELAKLFAPEIEIGLPGTEQNTYPKAAAESMLEKFFTQNKPAGSKILHKINAAGNYQYGVVTLYTAKGAYRVSFNLKDENGVIQLVKVLIEQDKVK